MRQEGTPKLTLITVLIGVVMLVLFGLSLGAVWVVSRLASDPRTVVIPTAPVAAILIASPEASATRAVTSQPLVPTSTPAPAPTQRVEPTATGTELPTLAPEPSATAPPTATLPVPTATVTLTSTPPPPTPPPPTPIPPPPTPRPTLRPPPPSATPAPTLPPPPPPATVPPPTVPVAQPTPTVPALAESIVIVPSTFVYDKPTIGNSIIGGIQRDDRVVVLGSSGTWYLIRISSTDSPGSRIEGGQGWIVQDAVSPPSQPVPEITP